MNASPVCALPMTRSHHCDDHARMSWSPSGQKQDAFLLYFVPHAYFSISQTLLKQKEKPRTYQVGQTREITCLGRRTDHLSRLHQWWRHTHFTEASFEKGLKALVMKIYPAQILVQSLVFYCAETNILPDILTWERIQYWYNHFLEIKDILYGRISHSNT